MGVRCSECRNPAKYLVGDIPRCGVHSEKGNRDRIGVQRFHFKEAAVIKQTVKRK